MSDDSTITDPVRIEIKLTGAKGQTRQSLNRYIAHRALKQYGTILADEIRIDIAHDSPCPLRGPDPIALCGCDEVWVVIQSPWSDEPAGIVT